MDNNIRYPEIDSFIRSSIKRETGVLKEIEKYAEKNFIPIIPVETAALLKLIVRMNKPLRILEAGTAIGYSASIMAQAMVDEGVIDTIEIDETRASIAQNNIKRLGLDKRIRILVGDAAEIMQCLTTRYDMIFLDASKGQYIEFLNECIRLLNKGGILISDNVLYKGLVAQSGTVIHKHRTIAVNLKAFIDSLCNDKRLETSLIPIGDGLALSYKLKD